MFGVPGPLGAKLGNFELGGWGAHVCYSLPSPTRPRTGPRTPKIGFLGSGSPKINPARGRGTEIGPIFDQIWDWPMCALIISDLCH